MLILRERAPEAELNEAKGVFGMGLPTYSRELGSRVGRDTPRSAATAEISLYVSLW